MSIDVLLWSVVLLPALAALAWIDIRTLRLPDPLTLPLIGTGLVQSGYFTGDVWNALIGAAAGYLFFLAIEKGYKALRGQDGLGRGDARSSLDCADREQFRPGLCGGAHASRAPACRHDALRPVPGLRDSGGLAGAIEAGMDLTGRPD